MTKLILTVLVGAFVGLAGCTDPNHYPISGEECAPSDPVLDLDASDCLLPN